MSRRGVNCRKQAYPPRYFTARRKGLSLILKAGLTILWLFLGLGLWGIATTTQKMPAWALASVVGCLLLFGAITFFVFMGRNLARIVPMYENLLPSAKTTGTLFSGAALAFNCGHLDELAEEHGEQRLSDFGFNDPLAGETVVWHEPAEGLATVSKLLHVVAEHPESVAHSTAVLQELGRLEQAFRLAREHGVRFALLLEIGSGIDPKDWEIRKAHF